MKSLLREIRTMGSVRGKEYKVQDIRILRHKRGNPETELCRSLNAEAHFSTRLMPTYRRAGRADDVRILSIRLAGKLRYVKSVGERQAARPTDCRDRL